MSYVRKTEDEFRVFVDYGQGWEHETTESTWRAARDQRKCYRDNGILNPMKITKARVKKESQQ